MKRKMKKTVSLVLVFAMSIAIAVPGFAATTDKSSDLASDRKEVVVSEEYAKAQPKPQYGESEVVTVLNSERHTVTVEPTGQPSEGFRLPTGGFVYVNTSGGPTTSIGVSVSWGVVGVSLSQGVAGTNASIGGVGVNLPDTTHYFKIKVDNNLLLEHHKVDVYQYDVYQYTYYTDVSEVVSKSIYAVRA